MILKGLQTFWIILNIFLSGEVPLFEPYAVQFPNASTKEIVKMHVKDYHIKLNHWLNGWIYRRMDFSKWVIAENTIRTMSFAQQAEFSDHLTQKMVQEPIHIVNEFIEIILSEVQNQTLNDLPGLVIGNMAFVLLHAPDSKKYDILKWFNKEIKI